MTTYKYQTTYYIEAPDGTDVRKDLGIRFEDGISERFRERVEKDLGYEVVLEHTRITSDAFEE